jgi:putative oxidoreductase
VKSNSKLEDYLIEQASAYCPLSNQLEVPMIDTRTAPYAALLLRATLGALFLAHAGLKLFIFTPAGTAQFFGSIGLPPALAYIVIAAEVLGGIALIVGLWTRFVAIALTPILVGAIFTVHGTAGFFFTNANGGWEFPALWAVALIVQALLGDGAFAWKATPAVTNRPALAQ